MAFSRNILTASGGGDTINADTVIVDNILAVRFEIPTLLSSPLTVGDATNYTGGNIVLANAATNLPAQTIYNSDAGGGVFVVDALNSSASINAVIGDVGTPIYLAAGGGQPTINRVTQPGYLDQCLGYSWGGYQTVFFNPQPAKIIPPSLLLISAPATLYTPLFSGGYSGSASNVTQANDLGSNGINAAKAGTGNILLTQMSNGVLGFDFGSANSNREFTMGTIPIASLISGNEFTIMAVVRATSAHTGSIFGWENNFDTFYFDYNSTANSATGLLFDTTLSTVTGTTPTLLNKTNILTWTRDSSFVGKMFTNSVQIGTISQPESPDGTATACQIGRSPSDGPFQGIIGTISFWKRVLPDAERLAIEAQLAQTFGILN